MSQVADITPGHEPISLLRKAQEVVENEGAVACSVILVNKDGCLWYDTCGERTKDILWALECSKLRLLRHVIDDIIEDQ